MRDPCIPPRGYRRRHERGRYFRARRHLASNPTAGDVVAGTGGCRKLRWAGCGKGKSGGYRTITFYSSAMMPVYLLTVFGKGEKANLSDAECNALRAFTKAIVAEHQEAVAALAGRKGTTR